MKQENRYHNFESLDFESLIDQKEGKWIFIDLKENFGDLKSLNLQILDEINSIQNDDEIFLCLPEVERDFEFTIKVLKELHDDLAKKNVRVVFLIRNPFTEENFFNTIIENRLILPGGKIDKELELIGYTKLRSRGVCKKENGPKIQNEASQEFKNTLIYEYLSSVLDTLKIENECDYYIFEYKPVENINNKKPFLSIITRTQGKRPESLKETLLSLAGQSCDDFELLIIGHNISQEESRSVSGIIEDSPEYLKKKIRFYEISGGNRSTPLNYGFELSNGEYAVILDDDDIVFDNWVSTFKYSAKYNNGKVLHAYVVAQEWRILSNGALRASGSPQNQFCKDFDWLEQLYGNTCPVLGLAFPLFPFRFFDLKFDETLDTTEDWDYLMRICAICGVVDIKEPTSIYRLWKNAENSYSLHDKDVWLKNQKRIHKKLESKPYLLPSVAIGNIIKFIENNQEIFKWDMDNQQVGQITTLYLNDGSGFSEENAEHDNSHVFLPNFKYEFTDLEKYGEIVELRFDPHDRGGIAICDLKIIITYNDGETLERTAKQVYCNGFLVESKIVIYHSDPQINFKLPKKRQLSKVEITGVINTELKDADHESVISNPRKKLIQKGKKAGAIIMKRVFHNKRK